MMVFIFAYLINLRAYPDSVGSHYVFLRWEKPDSMDYEVDSVKVKKSFTGYITDPEGWGHKLKPPFPDSFAAPWTYYDGIYYYFSVFSYFNNGTYALDTIRCISPAPPWVNAYYPTSGIYEGDTLLLLSTRYSSLPEGVERGIKVFSYHKGDTFADYTILPYFHTCTWGLPWDTTHYYFFYVYPHLRSFDTVVVKFISDSIRNNRGNWPLDGDYDRIKEGSPEDDFVFSFISILKGDYNRDGIIDLSDFAYFADLWYNQRNIWMKELAPYTGKIPYILVYPDSTLDFDDFSAFILMWRWSRQNQESKNLSPEGVCEIRENTLSLSLRGVRAIMIEGVESIKWEHPGLEANFENSSALAFKKPLDISGLVCSFRGNIREIKWVDSNYQLHRLIPWYTLFTEDISIIPETLNIFDVSGREVDRSHISPGVYFFRGKNVGGKIILLK
ncbi:hypothetical protein DRQ20_04405 [bacterium]|nr:MAG: hypothetical protein DRQ20_04405 [bacterium]